MKKTLISLLATITIGIVATSCVGDSHKDTIMTAQPVMYCRAVNPDGTDVHFTTSTYVVTLNYTKNTIAFEGAAGVDKSSSVYIITDDMPLTFDSSGAYNAYKFACATFKDNNGKEISNLHGWFDGNTGLAFLTFDAEGKHFYATPMIGFPYCTTTSVPEDQATSPYIAEEASFYCTLNKEKMTATILFANLHLSSVLAINAPAQIQYTDVPITVTTTGYKMQAERLDPFMNTDSGYVITDFDAEVTNNGLDLIATFKCKGHNVTFKGKLFSDVKVM